MVQKTLVFHGIRTIFFSMTSAIPDGMGTAQIERSLTEPNTLILNPFHHAVGLTSQNTPILIK